MPLATIHLLALTKDTTIPSFLSTLKSTGVQPLIISKVIRWIITPTKIDADALLQPKWDILVIILGTDPLPATLTKSIQTHWHTTTGIPSRLTKDFAQTNDKLIHPPTSSVPPLTGSLSSPHMGNSSQTLELSSDLASWIQSFAQTPTGSKPLSMLNLLAFKPGMKDSYLVYGKAFAESIGARRGGNAKLVGNVVPSPASQKSTAKASADGNNKWDEFALASYPSILHFADMLASEDYQSVNLKYRVPALEDTLILCTSELEIERLLADEEKPKGKL